MEDLIFIKSHLKFENSFLSGFRTCQWGNLKSSPSPHLFSTLTSHKSFVGSICSQVWLDTRNKWRAIVSQVRGKYAESSAIITCQMEEIVPLKQGRLLQMTYAYLHSHTPSIHPSRSLSLSCLLPQGIHFLLSIHMSVPPSTILPLQIYSGIRNEILLHFWLVLNAFIQTEACENDFHWGEVRAHSLLNMQTVYAQLRRAP